MITQDANNFIIQQSGNDQDLVFRCDDGSGGVTSYITLDGSGTLINIAQHMDFNDDVRARFGASGDLQIVHTGNINYIHSTVSDRDIYFRVNDGGTNLNSIIIDGSEIGRVKLPNDNQYLSIGASGDLYFYHDGSNSLIRNATGNLHIRVDADDSDLILESDDGSGGTTPYITLDGSATKVQVDKNMVFSDNVQAQFGGNVDLKIYHNSSSSNNNIENYSGSLYVTNYVDDADIVFRSDNGSGGVAAYLTLDGSATRTNVHKDLRLDNSVNLSLGGGGNMSMSHDGSNAVFSNATGNLTIQVTQDDGDLTLKSDDGGGGTTDYIKLDGGEKRTYLKEQVRVSDSKQFAIGNGDDLELKHDGSNFYNTKSYRKFNHFTTSR